jgi:TolB protein
MKPRIWLGAGSVVAGLTALVSIGNARPQGPGHSDPSRYGHSDRVERHMLPAVSTGPMAPVWSPDGRWIAFSMRGDIWKIPADGGEAIALTSGPGDYFEPAWSPDSKRIAMSMDTGNANLDIGIVSADGGAVQRVTNDPEVDVEPVWSHDGKSIYFVSPRGPARGESFHIYRHDLASATDEQIVAGIQPAVSPDGNQLAYVAPERGRLGSGGIWVKPLPSGEPRLVQYEESEYRMRPVWTPDATSLMYVSDEGGSNDVMIVPVTGGNPERLTADARDEYEPSPSPDGNRFAFVSNRAGATVLYTAGIGGGPFSSWSAVPIRSRKPVIPNGRVHVRVLGPDGKPTPARIYVTASDGRGYAPEGGFHRAIAATGTQYFHTTGTFDVNVPAGQTRIEALKGYEYRPSSVKIDVAAGGTKSVSIRLARLVDLPARGWYSGDTHIHDLHQGRFGLTHQTFFDELRAEDLHVTNALIHMDGTRLMGRWDDLTGKPSPLSTSQYILQYAEEFRGLLGHISILGISRFVMPLTGGVRNTSYAQPTLDAMYIDSAHAQGGIAGFPHPYYSLVKTPEEAASTLIPVDAALGKGDYYDIGAVWSDELSSAEVYYRLLNCGFRIPATSGTDNFSDVWRDPPPGSDRTYVHVKGALTLASWFAGIKAGHTFGSTGPLVFLNVAGREPGDEIALASSAPRTLSVSANAESIAPMSQLDILVNGKVVRSVTPSAGADSLKLVFSDTVAIPEGGWIAARVIGPSSRYIGDGYSFAQTSPVYVVRGGHQYVSADDAHFLGEAVDAVWTKEEHAPWRTDAERDRFHNEILRARAVYQRLEDQAKR